LDRHARSWLRFVPIMQNGKVVDSQGFTLDPEDD
jgi:hypothetical protein